MTELEKVIKGIECCLGGSNADACEQCPYEDECAHAVGKSPSPLRRDALSLLKAQEPGWISADNRPPSQGHYLVYGLTNFVPDHIDQPNAYWEVKIAYWSDRFGWDDKVKYWMPLPEPPKEG